MTTDPAAHGAEPDLGAAREHRRAAAPCAAVRLPAVLLAAVCSGLLLAQAHGLEPAWWSAWLAPGPVVWAAVAARRARWGIGAGALAGLLGSLSLIGYLAELAGPVDAALLSLLRAAQWAWIAAVARLAGRWLPASIAAFVPPAALAGLEPLIAVASPHGSAGTIAVGQAEALAALQLASLGGTAAVVLIVALPGSALAIALAAQAPATAAAARPVRLGARLLPLIAPLLIAALALGWGGVRAADLPSADFPSAELASTGRPADDAQPIIALLATDRFEGIPRDWRAVWAAYEPAVDAAAAVHGAGIVVLPEKIVAVPAAEERSLLELVAGAAARTGAVIVLGVDLRADASEAGSSSAAADRNHLLLVASDGSFATYDKRHLVPGLESRFEPGESPVSVQVPGSTQGSPRLALALMICKDMDFPATAREAALVGAPDALAAAFLVPAWDFDDDAWFHARLATLRGVELGLPVGRTARQGLLTVSDARGRVVAEATSSGMTADGAAPSEAADFVEGVWVVAARLPAAEAEPTLYRTIGELPGWALLAASLAATAWGVLRRAELSSAGPYRASGPAAPAPRRAHGRRSSPRGRP